MANKQIRYGIGFDVDSSSLTRLKQQLKEMNTAIDLQIKTDPKKQNDLQKLRSELSFIDSALEKSYNFKLDSLNLKKFNQELNKNGVSLTSFAQKCDAAGVQGKIAFRQLSTELTTVNKNIKQSSNLLDSMANTLGNTIKWSIASTAINTVTGAIQKAWGFTKNLDKSLNDIRIVTGQSAEQMDKFADKANKAAKALGANTTAYTKAALIYYQQGLGETDVQARTEATVKAANVTGQSASEVSEQLTAVWNGYKVVAEEAELYVDKLAAVAATTAADLEELSDGMSKVASAANTMGVDIDQLSAQLATIVSVTRQDASAVGTALKTIFARMGDLKVDGVDEFGTSLGDVSGQMKQMGIDVLDQQGNLRDMGEVIEEVAAKWGTWTDAQQQAAAVAMAGKRQYNNLIALFENWDMYESALNTSQNSAGTLQKQQDIYLDSLEGKLNQLATAGEKIYKAIFDSESMKDVIDVVTTITDKAGDFIERIGGGGMVLMHLANALMTLFNKQISSGIERLWTNITGFAFNFYNTQQNIKTLAEAELNALANKDEKLQRIHKLQEQQLKYSSLLTAEQETQANDLIRTITAEENKLELLKAQNQEAKKAVKAAQRPGSAELNIDNEADREIAIRSLESEAAGLEVEKGALEANKNFIDKNARRINNKNYNADQNLDFLTAEESWKITDQGEEKVYNDVNSDKQQAVEKTKSWKEKQTQLDTVNSRIKMAESAGLETPEAEEAYKADLKEQEKLTAEVEQAKKEAIEATTNAINKQKEAMGERKKEIDKDVKSNQKNLVALKNYDAEVKQTTKNIDAATAAHKRLMKEAQTKAIFQLMTNIAGAISNAATAFMSFRNTVQQLKEGDLSGLEKAMLILSNLGMILPMVTTSFTKVTLSVLNLTRAKTSQAVLDKALTDEMKEQTLLESARQILNDKTLSQEQKEQMLKTLGVQQLKDENGELTENIALESGVNVQKTFNNALTEEGTKNIVKNTAATKMNGAAAEKAGIKAFLAGLKAQLGFWPLVVIGALLAATLVTIVALLSLIFKSTDGPAEKAKKRLEEAKKAAAEAAEAFREAQEAYADFKDELADYKDAQIGLTKLRKGTEEWKDAVLALNTQVLSLIEKYPILMDYLKIDEGVYSIQEEGWKALEEQIKQEQQKRSQILAAKNYDVDIKGIEAEKADRLDVNDNPFNFENNKDSLNYYINENATTLDSVTKSSSGAGFSLYSGLTQDTINAGAVFNRANKSLDKNNSLVELDEKLQEAGLTFTSKDLDGAIYHTYDLSDETKFGNVKLLELEEYLKTLDQESEEAKILNQVVDHIKDTTSEIDETKKVTSAYLKSILEKMPSKWEGFDKDVASKVITNKAKSGEMDVLTGEHTVNTTTWLGGARKTQGNEIYNKSNTSGDKAAVKKEIKMMVKAVFGKDAIITGLSDSTVKGTRTDVKGRSIKIDGVEYKIGDILDLYQQGVSADILSGAYSGKDSKAKEVAERNKQILERAKSYSGTIDQALYYDNDYGSADLRSEWDKSLAELENIQNFSSTQGNETTIDNDALVADVDKITGLLAGTFSVAAKTGINDAMKQLTESEIYKLKDGFESIFRVGGENVATQVKGIFSGIEDPEKLKQATELLSNTDFSNADSVDAFVNGLKLIEIEIGDSNTELLDFIKNLTTASKLWISNSKKVIENLKTIDEIAKDIKIGDIISDEDYQKLIAINPSLKGSFVRTASGYKALDTGEKISKEAKRKYTGLDQITNEYQGIREAATAASKTRAGKQDFDATTITNFDDYFSPEDITLLAKASGINSDSLKDEIDSLVKIATNTDGTYSEAEILSAKERLQNYANSVNQAKLDVSSGVYDESQALEIWGTSIASSWSDVKNSSAFTTDTAGNRTNQEIFNKLEQVWRNNFVTELGYAEDFFDGLDTDTLEKKVKEVRSLELDYLKDINKQIQLNNIERERTFGIERKNILSDNISNQKKVAEDSERVANIYKNQFEQDAKNYEEKYGSNFINDETGAIDIIALQKELLNFEEGTPQYIALKRIIELYDGANENALKVTEAQYSIIDAQLEVLKYQQELLEQFEELQNTLREFNREFGKDFNDIGLNIFNEKTGSELLNEALEDIGLLNNEIDDLSEKTSGYKEAYDKSQNGDPLANLFVGIKNEFIRTLLGVSDSQIELRLKNTLGEDFASYFTVSNGDIIADTNSLIEDWGSDIDKLIEKTTDFNEKYKVVYDAYFTLQEELIELYDKQTEALSNLSSLLENSISLMKITGQNTTAYYENLRENAFDSYDILSKKVAAMETEYNNILALGEKASKEQIETARNNYQAALQEFSEAGNTLFESLASIFEEKMTELFDLGYLNEDWEREKTDEENYLDAVNATYSINKFNRDVQKSIDETNSLSAQNKLVELRNKQEARLNQILETRGKLSQYELDRANAEYDLTLKQIALEEAQQTANKMKLTRDAMGNYTYQYVQDEDKIAEATQALEDAELNLYNKTLEQQENLANRYVSIRQEAEEKINEAILAGDTERAEALAEYYDGLLSRIRDEIGASMGDLETVKDILTYSGEYRTTATQTFIEGILAKDKDGNLFNQVKDLIGSAFVIQNEDGTTINALTLIENSLGEKGALATGIKNLQNVVDADLSELNSKSIEIAENSASALAQLIAWGPIRDALNKSVETLTTEYGNILGSSINKEFDDNTSALIANTAAINLLTAYAQDLSDNILDGKNNGNLIDTTGNRITFKVTNNETGEGIWEIDANDTSET